MGANGGVGDLDAQGAGGAFAQLLEREHAASQRIDPAAQACSFGVYRLDEVTHPVERTVERKDAQAFSGGIVASPPIAPLDYAGRPALPLSIIEELDADSLDLG